MILAVDVQYDASGSAGSAAGVVFYRWTDPAPLAEAVRVQRPVLPYVSGELYRSELPCILPLVREIAQVLAIETVVVDAYVDLGAGRPGLGRHLFDALGGAVEVVGVAKTRFAGAPAVAVLRRGSHRPLWVSSTADAAARSADVRVMHGAARMPTLLRRADELARAWVEREERVTHPKVELD